MRNEKYSVEQVKAALKSSQGFMTIAASKLSCTTQTLRNYIKRYPEELADIMPEENERVLDFAESQLLKKIKDGNIAAIIFFLKTRGKVRGYSERLEMTGADGGPIQNESKNINLDELQLPFELRKALVLAIEEQQKKLK